MNPSVSSNVWGEILHSLSGRLNHQTLERWFGPIQFESLDRAGQVIHLRAPTQVIKDWVVSNYSKLLDESLNDLSLNGYSLGWQIDRVSESASTSTFTETVIETTTTTSDRDIVPVSHQQSANATFQSEPSLSSRYTYDSFVVGSCNQFAHAASTVAWVSGRHT